jgi:hypothetical protein
MNGITALNARNERKHTTVQNARNTSKLPFKMLEIGILVCLDNRSKRYGVPFKMLS